MTENYAGMFIMNNSVKVIFLPDILSHSYTHIYLWRFAHRRIQAGAFGLPELGVDSTLPQFVKIIIIIIIILIIIIITFRV